jgi:hypothetical protein
MDVTQTRMGNGSWAARVCMSGPEVGNVGIEMIEVGIEVGGHNDMILSH